MLVNSFSLSIRGWFCSSSVPCPVSPQQPTVPSSVHRLFLPSSIAYCRVSFFSGVANLHRQPPFFLMPFHSFSDHSLPAVLEMPMHRCPPPFTIFHWPISSLSHSHLLFHLVNKQKRVVEVEAPFLSDLPNEFISEPEFSCPLIKEMGKKPKPPKPEQKKIKNHFTPLSSPV